MLWRAFIMRINFDRLSKLAGIPGGNNRGGLYEGKDHAEQQEMMHNEMDDLPPGAMAEADEDSKEKEETVDTDLDELVEIDEVMLVQELRRAKRIMNENKRRNLNESRKRQIFERQLKQVIDEEVQNVMDEMHLTAGWV